MGTDYISFLFQIMACFLLSACIGVERQYRRRNVGLRTIILVSLGSFLFVRFSFAFPKSDMTRVAAHVVAGIGFLGAGVIIKDDKSVKGLTTAATLWCSAAIGILCSANLIFEATIGTVLILFTNIILRSVNSKINFLSGNVNYNLYHYTIVGEEKNDSSLLKIIKEIVRKYKISIKSLETNDLENGNVKISLCILSNCANDSFSSEIMQKLSERRDVISISLNKEDGKFLYEEEEL